MHFAFVLRLDGLACGFEACEAGFVRVGFLEEIAGFGIIFDGVFSLAEIDEALGLSDAFAELIGKFHDFVHGSFP